ncbi:G-protein-signaling modulator 1 [Ctenopharyngodon idella]|uniref:G-protein-signaling modulator 1 n=1 Tax=Ctenopharyngodon idella TaxID=7959 RepID=UPI0022322DAA|nr:G-protein-signaling modulator 1 [Ctenopharyngodon idella]
MDCPEVKAETSADDKHLEPLLILEEGDEPSDVINSGERGRAVLRVWAADENTEDEAAEGSSHDHNNVRDDTKTHEGLSDGTAEVSEEKPTAQAEVKLRPKDTLSPHDAKPTAHRLSPDFPDALCELLFALQEGRRLNDQRCSFRLEHRRRCYSEPSTPRHSQRVVFSSMTSLQKEEFFDLLATSQARRLDDQRAELQNAPPAPPPPLTKAKQRRSSCKVTEVTRAVPTQTPKEDLYNMIVNSQAQGRLEEQRSAAPGPMDDEDFFSLLLKVQGGRMDEQRTELKPVH